MYGNYSGTEYEIQPLVVKDILPHFKNIKI